MSLLVFKCLKLEIAKVFFSTLASALLFTFVENELSLQPLLFKTSSLLVHIPANVGSQLIDNFLSLILQLKKFSVLTNSC